MSNKYLDFLEKYKDVEAGLMETADSDLLFRFSGIRTNLLSWYDFCPEAAVLEIGCGCGVLTKLLAERVREVVAVEESEDCVNAAGQVLKDCENVKLIQGTISDVPKNLRFDYILLIGALSEAEKPEELICRVREHLSPNGVLVIAMENKYGLKYFAGANDEYTGQAFGGIEGCRGHDGKRAYSKEEVVDLLTGNGLSVRDCYYPVPDYRMPLEIYSQEYPPREGSIRSLSPDYERERLVTFDEVLAFSNICRDGLYDRFANSYLLFCQ